MGYSLDDLSKIYKVGSCKSGKVPHHNLAEAYVASVKQNEKHDPYGLGPSMPYRCPTCGLYHIGRSNRRK